MIVNICWFRRDLRLTDHAALYHALQYNEPVLPLFIFDSNILNQLDNTGDARVTFIHSALEQMQEQLVLHGTSLVVMHDTPINAFKQLISQFSIKKVFTNHDYEPYALERDSAIQQLLQQHGIEWHSFKDQVIFERDEIIKDDGHPYTVFTPYSKKWKLALTSSSFKNYPSENYLDNFFQQTPGAIPSLSSIGFVPSRQTIPPPSIDEALLKQYHQQRDKPAIHGTSRLGVHLRFGTISIRQLVKKATQWNETFLNELIWREFFQMILWHFPHVGKGRAFKPAYDFIPWRNNEEAFARWCEGRTGYPIVDAGMRELHTTGFMHNRVRMITASFLVKHLLIDWRWGEAWFAKQLLDFELASNNGNWQWAAGCGCDAAPYFRIFNPALQTKKFDPALKYVKQWVPELDTPEYPSPIVDHEFARKRCLEVYSKTLKQVK